MSDLQANSTTLPDECLGDIQLYLRTNAIVAPEANGFRADILGVPCAIRIAAKKAAASRFLLERDVDRLVTNERQCARRRCGIGGGYEPRSLPMRGSELM